MPHKAMSLSHLANLLIAVTVLWLVPAMAIAQESTSVATKDQNSPLPSQVMIEKLTWTEVRDALASGTTTIIIPTGGTEQNGRHMVLGKHNFIVAETARRIAHRLGKTLVAPVMAYVPEGDLEKKTGQMAYPGTISLSTNVFEQVLEQAARSFKVHGFKTIAFIGDSGGNQASQQRVARRLTEQWQAQGIKVIHVSDYYANNGGEALLLKAGETKDTIGSHAGIRDTSELMVVYPDGVDLSKAQKNQDGASGDATKASKSYGEKLLNAKVEAALKQIKALMSRDSAPTNNTPPASKGILSWLLSAIF